MSKWDVGTDADSDDPDELEVGCVAYSRTHFRRHDFPRGGTVIRLNVDADDESLMSVTTMEQNEPGRLDTFEIAPEDVNMETVSWYGRNARVAAEIINKYLGSKSGPKDTHNRLRWQRAALELAEAAAAGNFLPGAEKRVMRAREQQRRDRAAEAAS